LLIDHQRGRVILPRITANFDEIPVNRDFLQIIPLVQIYLQYARRNQYPYLNQLQSGAFLTENERGMRRIFHYLFIT
jgi:hypothetical protein